MDTENKQKNSNYSDSNSFFSLLNKAINPSVSSLSDFQKSMKIDEHNKKKNKKSKLDNN